MTGGLFGRIAKARDRRLAKRVLRQLGPAEHEWCPTCDALGLDDLVPGEPMDSEDDR